MSWLEGFAGCMLAVGLAVRMLPDRKYEQYIRLFTGFIMVILVLHPLLRIGSADRALERKIREFAEEQEKLEEKVFEEGRFIFAEREAREDPVREIVIEKVEVGDD